MFAARPIPGTLVLASPSSRSSGWSFCLLALPRKQQCRQSVIVNAAERVPRSKSEPAQPDSLTASNGLTYGEALLQREYELWQRQNEMMERMQQQHDADRLRWEQDRSSWVAQEARLQQELSELRSQLLFVLTKLGEAGGSSSTVSYGGPATAPPTPPAVDSFSSSNRGNRWRAAAAAAAGLEGSIGSSAALPAASSSSSVRSTGGEQVRAAIEALRAANTSSGGSSSTPAEYPVRFLSQEASSGPEAAPADQPAFAADLLAALAAVDEADVLNDNDLKAQMAQWRQHAAGTDATAAAATPKEAAAPGAAPASAPAPAAAAPSPSVAARPAPAPPTQAAAAPAPAPAAAEPPAAAAPAGPPPTLVVGADDIFWVNQLHSGLVEAGYYPGDEDIEDFFFGDSTQSALLTMQACEGLPETGVADEASWVRLLGPELRPLPSKDLGGDGAAPAAAASLGAPTTSSSGGAASPAAPKAFEQLFSMAFSETVERGPGGEVHDSQRLDLGSSTVTPSANGSSWEVQQDSVHVETDAAADREGHVELHGSAVVQHSSAAPGREQDVFTEWPVLFEGDGGRAVHGMQVALQKEGFYPDDDELRWWQFGDTTLAALKTFQACSGLPESGVCDPRTWQLLLGAGSSPADITRLRSDESGEEEDLSEQQGDRVWLMGEQRWEDRSRVRRQQG